MNPTASPAEFPITAIPVMSIRQIRNLAIGYLLPFSDSPEYLLETTLKQRGAIMPDTLPHEAFDRVPKGLASRLSPGALRIYIALLAFRNRRTDQCNPRRSSLAARAGVSMSTIKRALCELRTKGIIATKRKSNYNEYEIIPKGRWPSAAPLGKQGFKNDPSEGSKMTHQKGQKWPITSVLSLYEPDVLEPDIKTEVLINSQAPVSREAASVDVCLDTHSQLLLFAQPVAAVKPAPENGVSRDWFETWWALYWRRVARNAAEKAFKIHVKTQERFEQVIAATKLQTPAMMAREPDHRPHGATWLNAERWNDEPSLPARKQPDRQDRSLYASVRRVVGARLAKGEKPW